MKNFTLISEDLQMQMDKTHVYHEFGAGGDNQSPHLRWDDAPEDAKSFVVTCYDPDAPTVSGWWHWMVFNVPADVNEFATGITDFPEGCGFAVNDYNTNDYGGACPPPGDDAHAYHFTVYALDVERLDLPDGTQPAMVMFNAMGHILAKATIISYYAR